MSLTPPSASNNYQVTDDHDLTAQLWSEVMASLAQRLAAVEEAAEGFEDAVSDAAIATAQALLQNGVIPQLDTVQNTLAALEIAIALAEDRLAALQSGGVVAANVTLAAIEGLTALNAQAAFAELIEVINSAVISGPRGELAYRPEGPIDLNNLTKIGVYSVMPGDENLPDEQPLFVDVRSNGSFVIQEARAFQLISEADEHRWTRSFDGAAWSDWRRELGSRKATKAKAEAGDDDEDFMTAARVKDAIAVLAPEELVSGITVLSPAPPSGDWLKCDGSSYLVSAHPNLAVALKQDKMGQYWELAQGGTTPGSFSFAGGKYVFISLSSIKTSIDRVTWKQKASFNGSGKFHYLPALGRYLFVDIGNYGCRISDDDLATMGTTSVPSGNSSYYNRKAQLYNRGYLYVAIDKNAGRALSRSSTGVGTWEALITSSPQNISSIKAKWLGNPGECDVDVVLAVTEEGSCYRSLDGGATWSTVVIQAGTAFYGLAWDGERWVAIASTGHIFISTNDGASWTPAGRVSVDGSNIGNITDLYVFQSRYFIPQISGRLIVGDLVGEEIVWSSVKHGNGASTYLGYTMLVGHDGALLATATGLAGWLYKSDGTKFAVPKMTAPTDDVSAVIKADAPLSYYIKGG